MDSTRVRSLARGKGWRVVVSDVLLLVGGVVGGEGVYHIPTAGVDGVNGVDVGRDGWQSSRSLFQGARWRDYSPAQSMGREV